MQNMPSFGNFGPNPNHAPNLFPPGLTHQSMMQMMQNGNYNNGKDKSEQS